MIPNFRPVLKVLSFALFNFQLFVTIKHCGGKLLSSCISCDFKMWISTVMPSIAIRGLWKAKNVELFKPCFTLLRGNHINPFHNGACDSDDCFHSKRWSFYHGRIMINKSTDCFGHTYWCLCSLYHTSRFFFPTKFHIALFVFLFFFFFPFIPASTLWLLANELLGFSFPHFQCLLWDYEYDFHWFHKGIF